MESDQKLWCKGCFSKPTEKSREETCAKLMKESGYFLIHSSANKRVIEGAGTACKELLEVHEDIGSIITPVGGGGLLSGTSAYAKMVGKVEQVLGAEPLGADDAYRSLASGKLVTQNSPDTIADGLRVSLSELTFSVISKYVDEIITVSEQSIIEAMRFLWERMKLIVEPSGAVPLAGLREAVKIGIIKRNCQVGLILSGGNLTLDSCFEIWKH